MVMKSEGASPNCFDTGMYRTGWRRMAIPAAYSLLFALQINGRTSLLRPVLRTPAHFYCPQGSRAVA
jgi:hypothetical protein